MPIAPQVPRPSLIEYNAQHCVLICCDCKYAIQKTALGSHLLRHKIYRGERQRLLSSFAQLRLLEPDDVQPPPAGSPPIPRLPVMSGYRCTATGCGSLWASVKRMRRHWSEGHGFREPPSDDFATIVCLQTFFRGTKLRYFEVEAPKPTIEPASSVLESTTFNLDLQTLQYFHHFTSVAAATLTVRKGPSTSHWQADVVAKALQLPWLMCGLLAISASHLAVLSDNETTKQAHSKQSARFQQEFLTPWSALKADPRVADIDGAKEGAQMVCIQQCYQWTSESPSAEFLPFSPNSFITAIQGCANADLALRFAAGDNNRPAEPLELVANSISDVTSNVPGTSPPELLKLLRLLPFRMAEALPKPDSASEFFTTVSALDVLAQCCSASYVSDDLWAVWEGVERWLQSVSVGYKQMVWRGNPAALVILAHWGLLVARAEEQCWFLKGSAAKLLHFIMTELPQDDATQSLVKDLLDTPSLHGTGRSPEC
ncbi:hypothetical protein B0T25DRAFT_535823 [Lasiosphaeria hispida]|uniref:C2H2-type domain-containing protein n=1 Tax=Lasiosphaeria hispida TaxID=260671 RepID=A0AAJ0HSE0_9PEZI|nr:hypothetical protein B0T25DRAFT_535823 [Lasiosphaeria hispida]